MKTYRYLFKYSILFAAILIGGGGIGCGGKLTQSNGSNPDPAEKACTPACDTSTQKCDNGTCVPKNPTVSQPDTCTGPGTCQDKTKVCKNNVCISKPTESCTGPGTCSKQDDTCINNQCVSKEDLCAFVKCPNSNYKCELGACIPTCDASKLCGGACCADNQVCHQNQCIKTPAKGGNSGNVLCETTAGNVTWCDKDMGCFETASGTPPQACQELFNECDEVTTFCRITQYCNKTYHRCVPYASDPKLCLFRPKISNTPKEILRYETIDSSNHSDYNQVMSTPVVGNVLDETKIAGAKFKQDVSEIVFTTFYFSTYNNPGILRVVSGIPDPSSKTTPPSTTTPPSAKEYWNSLDMQMADKNLPEKDRKPFYSSPSSTPAIADIDGDGAPDIVTLGWDDELAISNWNKSDTSLEKSKKHVLIAMKGDGTKRLWTAPFGDKYPLSLHGGTAVGDDYMGPMIADLDADGKPEVIVNNQIYNSEGKRTCVLDEGPGSYPRALLVADLFNDGKLEIVTSKNIFAYKSDNTGHTCPSVLDTTNGIDSGVAPTFMAIADLDKNGRPELVGSNYLSGITIEEIEVVGTKLRRVLRKKITIPVNETRAQVKCSGSSNKGCIPGGGIPILADFDGDGFPEIGIAARWYYLVFESDGQILWATDTNDFSSATTSSSVFDFDGDGKAEVVYNDENNLYVFDGAGTKNDSDNDGYKDAKVIYKIPNLSGTLREYPVIADLNHDGHANIIVAANDYGRGNNYHGIRVFAEPNNYWVPTRQIWNQFHYNVTNINDDGTVPHPQLQNWKLPWLNNFLQNVQKGNPFLAPNVTPVIQSVGSNSCNTSYKRDIIFSIQNIGSKAALKGTVPYKLVVSDNNTDKELVTGFNETDIPPGGSETITIANKDIGDGLSTSVPLTLQVILNEGDLLKECNNGDNTASLSGIEAASPNLLVENVEASCNGSTTLKVKYKISNVGADKVIGNGTVVKLYAGLEGNLVLRDTYTYAIDLEAAGSFEHTVEWPVPSELQGQPLKVRVVVDEDNTVVECKETDNERTVDAGLCVLYG